MAAGTSRKISAASARAHTRRPKAKPSSKSSGVFKKLLLVGLVGFLAWAYQAIRPPPPKKCGSPNGPPITAPRIQLKDGRYLAYGEYGVPKDVAKHKIVFVHGFDSCRHDVSAITSGLSQDIVESKGVYIVSFDRPGYGESDPHPNRTVKSLAFDIEELADQLGLGAKFYVVGFSMGGQVVWSCLKYIPHRLAGAALLTPVVNYWWAGFNSNLSEQAYKQQLMQDQWAVRVAHYTPWLTYWWNTQKLFPSSSVISYSADWAGINLNSSEHAYKQQPMQNQWAVRVAHYMTSLTNWWKAQKLFPASSDISHSTEIRSNQETELYPKIGAIRNKYQALVRQQGEYESLHRDMMIGFGKWDFDPTDLKNPFSEGEGSVHLWQGDDDTLVPVTLQRYIAHQLPWIHYHELPGAGHLFPYADGMADSIIQALIP